MLTARPCFVEKDGAPRLPATRERGYVPERDGDGFYGEQRVVYPSGASTVTSWHDADFLDRDWAVLVVEREPWMKAVELADHPPQAGAEVALVIATPLASSAPPAN